MVVKYLKIWLICITVFTLIFIISDKSMSKIDIIRNIDKNYLKNIMPSYPQPLTLFTDNMNSFYLVDSII